jgi:peptidyl-prolyl cis-trans isomerase C
LLGLRGGVFVNRLILALFSGHSAAGEKPNSRDPERMMGHMPHIHAILKSTLLAGVVGFGLVAGLISPVNAQDAAKDDKVIAIVNGHEIKVSEVRMAMDDIIGQLPDLPKKMRYPFVVEFLVERHLLAQLAVKDGIADTDEYKRRLALYQAKALRDAYFAQVISPKVTEDEIKAAYDQEAAKVAQTERIRARHILVASEKEAGEILAQLAAGAKFEDLAKKFSLDGSKEFGGDLGYFTAAEMVPEFSKAAFALKAGETSQPIKTDFGWHVIKLEDRKIGNAQPYDQVKGAIRNVLLRKKVQDIMASLRTTAKIEIVDADLKKFTEEAMKQRKAMEDKQAGQIVAPVDGQPTDGGAPADAGTADGKGDLELPQ